MITRQKARALRRMIEQAAVSLPDEDALTAIELYPIWQEEKEYASDERVRYEGKLYRCVQAHTSQAQWTPELTPALWTEVSPPGEIPVWKQPSGVQDAYMTGDMVHYPTKDDPVYESIADNNVWAPNVYGWVLVG